MIALRMYHFGTLLPVLSLALLISAAAHADGFKPQVETGSRPAAPVSPTAPPASALSPAGAVPPAGQPIVYSTTPLAPPAPQAQAPNQESQALQNAFGQLLNALGGGGGGANGGRSEFAGSGDGGSSYSGPTGLTPVGAADLTGSRKIIPPFQKWFAVCTQKYGNCRFENMGIMGDAAHRARRSCHNAGEAIDVATITCSGGQSLKPNSEEFFNVAKCMANDSNNELQVIFHKASGPNMIQKSDHAGHMHIQLKNCNMVYGQ